MESGIELPVGAIVGELGMLSPSNMRTQTLECIEGGLILSVSYTKVEELYVQNPAFGFYFLRLSSARLFENIEKLEQRLAQQAALLAPAAPRRGPPEEPRALAMASVLSSLRYLLSDFIGEDDDDAPFLPQGLPESAAPDRQRGDSPADRISGRRYARLYVDRLRRFVGKPGVDDAMFCEIARLMAMRMSYQDPIRIAQLKLAELEPAPAIRPPDGRRRQEIPAR